MGSFRAGLAAEFLRGHIVTPLAERALGELHDIALVHQGQTVAAVVQGIAQGPAHQPLGARLGHGLDAHGGGLAHLAHAQLVAQKGDELAGLGRISGEFHARVHVFRILAEDDHIHPLGMLDRGFQAVEMAHGPDAGIKIQTLAQGHVQAADARAHGRAQGAFHGDVRAAQGVHGGFGQGGAGFGRGLFPGQQFLPVQAEIRFLGQGRVNDRARGPPDFRADAVAFDPVDFFAHVPFPS